MKRAGQWRASADSLGPAWLAFATVVVSAALFLLWQVSPVANRVTEDESTYVYDAQRMLSGQVPYRDFFSFNPPGIYYALAGFSKLSRLGPETSERYLVLLAMLASFVAFLTTVRCRSRSHPLTLATLLIPFGFYAFAPFTSPHHTLALACTVAAIALLPRVWERDCGRAALALLGLLASLAASMIQTEGVVALAIALLALLAGAETARNLVGRLAWFAAGTAAVAVAWLVPLAWSGALASFWRDAVAWPLSHYKRPGNINDYPFLGDVPASLSTLWHWAPDRGTASGLLHAICGSLFYAGLAALCVASLVFAFVEFARAVRERRTPPPALLTAGGATFLCYGLFSIGRTSSLHLVFASVPVLCVWILVLGSARARPLRRTGVWTALLAVLLFAGAVSHARGLLARCPHAWEFADVDKPDRESPLNQSLRASPELRPGDTIVVLPSGGSAYLYAYPAAIGYTYLFPLEDGYHDFKDHERAAAEIEARKPKSSRAPAR